MKSVLSTISIVLLFVTISNTILGQYPPNTFFITIPPPASAVAPGYLSTYDDNTTSTRLKQITQEGGETHSYSKRQTWNIDETKYKIRSIAVYDAETHAFYRSLEGRLDLYESVWSNTDPNIVYGFTVEGKIRRYNISTEVSDLLHDLNESSEVYAEVKLGLGEGNIDIHDKYVALVGHVKNTSDLTIIIFDLQMEQVVTTKTFVGMWRDDNWQNQYIDWVSVSQSGNYLGIMWNHNFTASDNPYVDNNGDSHYGVEMYNTTDLNYLRRLVHYGNHGDFGYAPDGTEVFAQFYGNVPGEYGSVFSYHLDGSGVDIIHTNTRFEYHGNHLSCRNILRPGWAYLNTMNSGGGDGRMLAVKLDGSELIENFGHTFTSSGLYNTHAFPVPNPRGTKIMFKSNFGDSSSEDKMCLYVAYPIPFVPSKSLAFNGDATRDEYVITYDENNFVTGDNWTMESWVKFDNFDASGGEDHIMRLGGQLFVDGNNNLKVKAGGSYVGGSTILTTGVWYHIAYVRTSTEVTVYLNGVSEIVAPGLDEGSANRFLLGSYGEPSTSYNFAGKMDEVRLWNVARTIEEVNATKDVELTGSEADLLIYYNFNTGGGNALVDRAGGENNGVLHNMETEDWNTNSSPVSGSVPVELTSFTAVSTGLTNVLLKWNTATEVNNYGFEIERSVGNISKLSVIWETIGFVSGHGNSNSPKEYSFIDKNVPSGIVNYRLKQLDADGSFEYSSINIVNSKKLDKYALQQNSPNPFNPTTVISYTLPDAGLVRLSVFNILGQEVKILVNEKLDVGSYSTQFNGSSLSSGVYFYILESNNHILVKKMLLLK